MGKLVALQTKNMPSPGYYPPTIQDPDPRVIIKEHELLSDLTSYAEKVLSDAHRAYPDQTSLRVFRHGNEISRVGSDDVFGIALTPADKDGLYGVLIRAGIWLRAYESDDGHGGVKIHLMRVDPPRKMVLDLMSWPDLQAPKIRGIASHPMLRPDGQWAGVKPGYDPDTEYWYAESGPIPRLAVDDAKHFLFDWLADFPIDQGGKADLIGMMIGNILRPWLTAHGQWSQPGLVFDASEPGSGKTLLAQGIAAILTGQGNYHIQSCPESDEEWRKNITSWVQLAAPVQIYDNLPQKGALDSGSLAALLTSGHWRDRLLGHNTVINAPVSCQVIFTGNNVALSSELSRRVVWIRLVPAVDQPWMRKSTEFQHPTNWPIEHRAELLGALVALIHQWVDAGMPMSRDATMGSYEVWAQAVGGVLEANGIPGFLTNRDKATARLDEDRQVWLGFLGAWYDRFGEQPVRTKDLWTLVEDGTITLPWFRAKDEDGKRKQLGTRIRNKADAVIGSWQIQDEGYDRTNVRLYRLVKIGEAEPSEPEPHNEVTTDSDNVNVLEVKF